jgi:hypothetical protein
MDVMDAQSSGIGILRQAPGAKRFLLLACEVLYRELSHLCARTPHRIDPVWLSQGLHDLGSERMVAEIQKRIDEVQPEDYDAILLGFALCNNGTLGLRCEHTPLVMPKAHDCITLFLGSRARYRELFDQNPGTYYLTTGWMERDDSKAGAAGDSVQDQMGLGMSYAEMVEKYGEENAKFLAETMGGMTVHYNRMLYIRQDYEEDLGFEEEAQAAAAERGWEFAQVDGDLRLLGNLVNGEWDEETAVAQPGETFAATYDDAVLCARCRPGGGRNDGMGE